MTPRLCIAGLITAGLGLAARPSQPAGDSGAKPLPPTPGQPQTGAGLGNWGNKVDPNNDCPLTIQDGGLELIVPPTAHDLSAEMGRTNAPRVLREMVGATPPRASWPTIFAASSAANRSWRDRLAPCRACGGWRGANRSSPP